MNNYDALFQNIVSYANEDERVTALIMIGSRARKIQSADKFSDLDLILVSSDAGWFVNSNEWISEIGKYHISFMEKSIAGTDAKRVIFEDALDVDFVIVSKNDAETALLSEDGLGILKTGYRVLVDKVGIQAAIPSTIPIESYVLPSEEIYKNVVNDFWYHTIWTAKKLLRGELWTAKFCLDSYMKYKLLWMIEFYEHIENGENYNTWYGGRFVDTWANDKIVTQLATTFAHYDTNDMIIALKKTMDLFRNLALHVAKKTDYQYPIKADDYAARWVNTRLVDSGQHGGSL